MVRRRARSVVRPGDLDLLQLAIREEPDEPAVRRPERERPAFGPRNRPGGQAGDRAQVDLDTRIEPRRRRRCSGHRVTPRPESRSRCLRQQDRQTTCSPAARWRTSLARPWTSRRRPTAGRRRCQSTSIRARERPPPPTARRVATRTAAGVMTGAPASSGAPPSSSSIRSRASPMSRSRALGSFVKQRVSRRRSATGVAAGKALPVGILQQDGRQRRRDVVAREGPAAGQHLVEHAAERPDVGALVDRLALGLLRRHVGRGAEDHPAHRHRRRRDGRRVRQVRRPAVADRRPPAPAPWPGRNPAPSRRRRRAA